LILNNDAPFFADAPTLLKSQREKISVKIGDTRLRKGLYWLAIAASQCNPLIRGFGHRLRQCVKANMGLKERFGVAAMVRGFATWHHDEPGVAEERLVCSWSYC